MSVIKQVEIRAVNSDHRVHWTEDAQRNALTTTIVQVTDSDGIVGISGSDSYTPGAPDLSVAETIRSLSPALLGRDIACRATLGRELRIGVVEPHSPSALAAIDVALWDLAARRSEMPLYEMLGGARQRIAAYASSETMKESKDYLDMVARARADGLRAVKVHAWGDPDRDMALLEQVREANPDLVLMHDAEGVYDRRGALRVGRRLENIGCRWFEAPLPDYDLVGYRELCRKLDVPILAAGYSMSEVPQFADALRDAPWAAVRSEIGVTGGITDLCKLAELAAAFDMDLEPVSYGHTLHQLAHLHVMLAFENVSYFELPYPVEPYEYGVLNPVRPDADGMVTAPEGFGLGIELDWAWVDAHTAAKVLLQA